MFYLDLLKLDLFSLDSVSLFLEFALKKYNKEIKELAKLSSQETNCAYLMKMSVTILLWYLPSTSGCRLLLIISISVCTSLESCFNPL